jgi:hypothetical protein
MGRRARECYLCGEDYLYCPTCSQDRLKPTWMAEFHSENCKNIFDICTRFNMNLMSKKESQEALKSCDLSNKENFKDYVQHDLEVIFEDNQIVVELDAGIKEVKAVVETSIRGNNKKKSHEVVIKKDNK